MAALEPPARRSDRPLAPQYARLAYLMLAELGA
jgi:hypothetical protein